MVQVAPALQNGRSIWSIFLPSDREGFSTSFSIHMKNIGFGWKILKKIENRQPSMEKLDGNSDEVVY
jgi:hypothetical protein